MSSARAIARDDVTGIVLAGGMGRRMGGVDKGLVELNGKAMVAHVIERLSPQVARLLVNANRNVECYAKFGATVVSDVISDFAGPLAGLHAGLAATTTRFAVTVPCDSPLLPGDLVARLGAALAARDAQLAVAKTFDQSHPVFALVRRDVLPHLVAFLESGGRKIDAWYATLGVVEVPFDDCADAFSNINTRAELALMSAPKTLRDASCADDYDPNSLPVERARALIRQFLTPIEAAERVHVRDALGRVLAEDVISPLDVPGHDNSAMDGWAVRFADLDVLRETTLRRTGESFAGKPFEGSVGAGEAVRIFTGAVMPGGADTVVMQERAEERDGCVVIAAGAVGKAGQNRRFAGEDLKRGGVVFRAGQPVRPAELGMIASLGINEVSVYRKLRVAFFSTGDELVSIGHPLTAGQVYDSNRYTLHGMLTRLGCEIVDMGVVRDVPDELERAFALAAANADVVITSGGVSVGEADYVTQLLDRLGEVVFWKIAMKPGRPLAYGRIGDAHFFGLPGNPVSVMVTFYQFVRDALLVLMGRRDVEPMPMFKATLAAPI
ncbi:MAG TPA: gephyrin-like molybdotransferase Glp, partial [Casimicrobiaceae bacterium]|nr:gephyrin-like molybdotransferase Glp [Casimicrobiaceae bacterium]